MTGGARRRRTHLVMAVATVAVLLPVAPTSSQATTPARCAPAATGGEWRSYGHDDANTRTQDQENQIGPARARTLAPVWTFAPTAWGASGDFTATPSVADGCVFAGSNTGWVFALNADTGALVWKRQVTQAGGISSSVAVEGGVVYAGVGVVGSPFAAALDEATGALLWQTRIDDQPGADEYGSPAVIHDTSDPLHPRSIVFLGVSGGSAELAPDKERFPFQGAFVLLDGATGSILKKTYTIHSPATRDNYAGATVWSTPAIDQVHHLAYVGTGNPFKQQAQSPHADAILKIDVDPRSPTFGAIVASYSGLPDTYVALRKLPCVPIPNNPPPYYPQGLGSCMQLDLDFGAAPNLFTGPTGRLLVGEGQKSGVYHAVDTSTMTRVWTTTVGPPSAVGGIVGSTAYDGRSVYGPITVGGYLWSAEGAHGKLRWASPVGDGAHYGNSVAVADGVVYTVDLTGFLDAYDAATGLPLLHRPLAVGSKAREPVLSWGGVSVARHTVYAAVGTTAVPTGYIVAFRPGRLTAAAAAESLTKVAASTVAVAGPLAQFTGYATQVVAASRTGKLTFENYDIVQHDFVSVNGLFSTPLIGLGQKVQVQGLQRLVAGRHYSFYCTIHPGMKGSLYVTG